MNNTIRARFAPSPTGHLHIGGLRTALFNWLLARSAGGSYLLRIEDTDPVRSTKEYLASQLAALSWAGIVSDEPAVYQMARADVHVAAARRLMQEGKAYPCFCPPRDADEVVANLESGHGEQYDKTCRNKPFTENDLLRPHAVRFRLPDGLAEVAFDDLIRGRIAVKGEYFDDYVIIRRDGSPIYNFCVVVDDIFMRITHIVRGEDHIANTTKQVLFYQALGAQPPQFAHLPLILGKEGNKLSKRDAAASVEEYRRMGYLPEALINYLARLGWSHGDQEIFTCEELVQHFSLDHVGKKGCIFDIAKLEWMNGVYLRSASVERIIRGIKEMDSEVDARLQAAWSAEQLARLIPLYQERATTLRQLAENIIGLASAPNALDKSLVAKWQNDKSSMLVNEFMEAVRSAAALRHDALLAVANEIVARHGEKLVHLAQMVRLALTGSLQSPGVFDLIGILGKEETLLRLEKL